MEEAERHLEPVDPTAGPGPGPEVQGEEAQQEAQQEAVLAAATHHVLAGLAHHPPAQRLLMTQSIRARNLPVMKPDITFFHEDLPADFYSGLKTERGEIQGIYFHPSSLLRHAVGGSLGGRLVAGHWLVAHGTKGAIEKKERDRQKRDHINFFPSQVQPVSRIPELVRQDIPHVLINREPLMAHSFDAELLGNCDEISVVLATALGLEEELKAGATAAAAPAPSVEAGEVGERRTDVADHVHVPPNR